MELAQIFFIGTVGATVGFALGVFITMAAYRKNTTGGTKWQE